jgi:glycerophosphoryl diester phosphodiesterase
MLLIAVLFPGMTTLPLVLPAAEPPPAGQVRIVAHRGLLKHAPENTAAAFRSCLALRLGFELDVQRTKDGRLVCLHDTTLDRTTNGRGDASAMTWKELQRLDAGTWFDPAFRNERIPLMDDVFAMIARSRHPVLIAVDVKIADPNVERDLVKLAVEHKILDRLVFIGRTIESADMRKRFKTADRNARTARLAKSRDELRDVLKDPQADWAYVRFIPTADDVAAIHRAKKRVILVGPKVAGKEPANWKAAVANGVDAILTDYPLELRKAVRAKR